MKLTTPIDIPVSPWHIGYEDHILLLGSCFADEMAKQMQERYLSVVSNPFGTLYNPLSIANAINLPMGVKSEIGNSKSQITSLPYTGEELCSIERPVDVCRTSSGVGFPIFNYNGLYHSMYHHGSFSRPTREETEQAVLASIEAMQKALNEASVIIVTFGTAWVYEMVNGTPEMVNGTCPNGKSEMVHGTCPNSTWIVANCHKLPDSYFTRRRLTVEEIVAAWEPIIARYPDKHWLFTVSPIRHIKDGLHENQLSKATLLMAIDQLTNTQSQIGNTQSQIAQRATNNKSQITSLPSRWRIASAWQSERPEQRGASLQPERSRVGLFIPEPSATQQDIVSILVRTWARWATVVQ